MGITWDGQISQGTSEQLPLPETNHQTAYIPWSVTFPFWPLIPSCPRSFPIKLGFRCLKTPPLIQMKWGETRLTPLAISHCTEKTSLLTLPLKLPQINGSWDGL